MREDLSGSALADGVDDLPARGPGDLARQAPVAQHELVAHGARQAEARREGAREKGEAPGDHVDAHAVPAGKVGDGLGAGHDSNGALGLSEDRDGGAREKRDAPAQALREVEPAGHRLVGDAADLVEDARSAGHLVDALVLDERAVHVKAEEPEALGRAPFGHDEAVRACGVGRGAQTRHVVGRSVDALKADRALRVMKQGAAGGERADGVTERAEADREAGDHDVVHAVPVCAGGSDEVYGSCGSSRFFRWGSLLKEIDKYQTPWGKSLLWDQSI